MADSKISGLPVGTAITGAEEGAFTQSGGNVKKTLTQILTWLGATFAPKASPVFTGAAKFEQLEGELLLSDGVTGQGLNEEIGLAWTKVEMGADRKSVV